MRARGLCIDAEMNIFNLTERQVKSLSENNLAPGEHQFEFDAADLPSGIHFARLPTPAGRATTKLLLLK
jgi:hypothetical protein